MTSRAQRVKEMFQCALELDTQERDAFLASAEDDGVRAEVRELLGALDEAGGFLADSARLEQAGAIIDRYQLTEEIGEGGFGVVWRAEQQAPMKRDVALKVIKLGMDTRRVVARFENERQALARMDHPNIAAVFDGGTTPSGRPYFVMELVRGKPIDEFCRAKGLGVEERIALVRSVCLAVQHAHQKGLIHRDLKPHNILVGEADGQPLPKVIDFGIAKAVDSESEITMTITGQGQIAGTLEYMAPEQADSSIDVDSRADVYALGVVLYELLTGRRPFERRDVSDRGLSEILRRIRSEAPRRPSTRVESGGRPLEGADPRRWARRLRGDLDWITSRALAKQPEDRYPTPNAFAEDLQRFLDGRPVQAGPPTASYRFAKFVDRNRLAVVAALVFVSTLIGGIVSTWLALEEVRAESTRRARAERDVREQLGHKVTALEAIRELLVSADPLAQKGADHTVRELMDDFAPKIEDRFSRDPEVALELHIVVGASYRGMGRFEEAGLHLGKAADIARSSDGPLGRRRLAIFERACLLREEARHAEALAAFEELAALVERETPDSEFLTSILIAIADIHRLTGQIHDGEPVAIRAVEILEALPPSATVLGRLAASLDLLGSFAFSRGDSEISLALHQRAIQLRQKDDPSMPNSLISIAAIEQARGNFAEATRAAQEARRVQTLTFGERHPAVARSIAMMGEIARGEGRLEDAARLAKEAYDLRVELLPAGHVDITASISDLGWIAMAQRDYATAEGHFREGLTLYEAAGDPPNQRYATLLFDLGRALRRQQRAAEAIPFLERSIVINEEIRGHDHPRVADVQWERACSLAEVGKVHESLELHRKVLAHRLRHSATDLVRLEDAYFGLARSCAAAGDHAAAGRARLRRAEIQEKRGLHPQRVQAERLRAGGEFISAGAFTDATAVLEELHSWCVEHLPDGWPRGDSARLLSICRQQAGSLDDAVDLASEACELLDQKGVPGNRLPLALRQLANAHTARAHHGRSQGLDTSADQMAAERAKARFAALTGN